MAIDIERVKASWIKLQNESAPALNAASDELARPIDSINKILGKLNIGLECRVEMPGATGQYKHLFVGYARVDNKWGLSLWGVEDGGAEEAWLYNTAPRWLRIRGIDYIPLLIEKLVVTVDETLANMRAAVVLAEDMAAKCEAVLKDKVVLDTESRAVLHWEDKMKRLWLVPALLAVACAGNIAVPLPPGTALPDVRYGINDGFHGPLPSDIAAHYYDYGGELTIRTPQLSKAGLNSFLLSIVTLPIRTIALIEGPDSALARNFSGFVSLGGIENGNELELPPYELTPEQYAVMQGAMCSTERAAGFKGDIIMGGVYALTDGTDGTKRAISLAHQQCPDAMVGVHLYEITKSDVEWLNGLDADVAITETGSPTGCGQGKWQEQADYLTGLRAAAMYIRRLKYFIVYQRPVGPSCTDLDTFGIEGKLADTVLANFVGRVK